jgi:hypothetical protein
MTGPPRRSDDPAVTGGLARTPPADILCISSDVALKCGLLSAKGGLMMGTKKVGAFSSPRKKANIIIALESPL